VGGDGGDVRQLSDVSIVVPSDDTQRIQEVQILILHLLCELVEDRLFGGGRANAVVEPAVDAVAAPPQRAASDRQASGH
jgi:hypothetical protein